jgi:hypothetical protein
MIPNPADFSDTLTAVGYGWRVGTCIRAGAKAGHPSIQVGVRASGAAQMFAIRAMRDCIVPGGQLQGGLTILRVERRRAGIGGDPPFFFHTSLLFAADVARESFNPSH